MEEKMRRQIEEAQLESRANEEVSKMTMEEMRRWIEEAQSRSRANERGRQAIMEEMQERIKKARLELKEGVIFQLAFLGCFLVFIIATCAAGIVLTEFCGVSDFVATLLVIASWLAGLIIVCNFGFLLKLLIKLFPRR